MQNNSKTEGRDLRMDFGKIDKNTNMIDGRERKGLHYRVQPLIYNIN